MRAVVAAVAAAAMLAACSQGGAASGGATEEAVAAKIVDSAGVLDLGDSTLKEVVNAQIQMVGYDHNLTPEQAEQLSAAIKKNIDAALPDLKKQMSGYLAETFDKKELDTYFAFVGSKEGEQVKQKIPAVMEKSIAAADQMTSTAVEKALAGLKIPAAAAPQAGAQPAQPEPTVPGVLKKPTDPQ